MDRGRIRRARHDTVEGIDLADDMSLAQPADCGVARHRADVMRRKGNECGAGPPTGGGAGGLYPCMSPTNYDHVEHTFVPSLAPRRGQKCSTWNSLFADAEPRKQRVEHRLAGIDPQDGPELAGYSP